MLLTSRGEERHSEGVVLEGVDNMEEEEGEGNEGVMDGEICCDEGELDRGIGEGVLSLRVTVDGSICTGNGNEMIRVKEIGAEEEGGGDKSQLLQANNINKASPGKKKKSPQKSIRKWWKRRARLGGGDGRDDKKDKGCEKGLKRGKMEVEAEESEGRHTARQRVEFEEADGLDSLITTVYATQHRREQ